MRTIDDQLREYAKYADETLPWLDPIDVMNAAELGGRTPDEPSPARRSNVLVAMAAAAAVLVLIGGVAWLIQLNAGAAPVDDGPVPTTISEEQSPELESVTETTLASPDTTLVVLPAVAPGEGPKLEFVLSEVPEFRDGVWFDGALFGILDDGLLRWNGGLDWEVLPGPSNIGELNDAGLAVGGGLLVYVGRDEAAANQPCAMPGATIAVHTSTDGVAWETSNIPLPIPDSSSTFGCHNAYIRSRRAVAVGPQGIIVSALIQGEIVAESIFEAEFGLGLEPETLEMSIGDGFMSVTTESGDVYDIDLAAAGYLEDIEAWLGVASDDPNFADLALEGSWHTGRGHAWFSPDGRIWTELGASGPLDGGEIADVVATSDGFAATSTSSGSPSPQGRAQDFLWETVNGTTWTEKSSVIDSHLVQDRSGGLGLDTWDGRLVAVSPKGVWTIEAVPKQLTTVALSGTDIGEFGLMGTHTEMEGGGTEVLFSEDGTTWNRWTPEEFGPEGTVYVMGVGDDFVALRLISWDDETQTGESSVWVGRLP